MLAVHVGWSSSPFFHTHALCRMWHAVAYVHDVICCTGYSVNHICIAF